MAALRLDHINIRTGRLAECVRFYGNALGLIMKPAGNAQDLSRSAYAHDEHGEAIIHLVATEHVIEGSLPERGAAQPGMIDHFALRCEDFAAHVERLTSYGAEFKILDVPSIGRRLIFVRDPNDVMVELGFALTPAEAGLNQYGVIASR